MGGAGGGGGQCVALGGGRVKEVGTVDPWPPPPLSLPIEGEDLGSRGLYVGVLFLGGGVFGAPSPP